MPWWMGQRVIYILRSPTYQCRRQLKVTQPHYLMKHSESMLKHHHNLTGGFEEFGYSFDELLYSFEEPPIHIWGIWKLFLKTVQSFIKTVSRFIKAVCDSSKVYSKKMSAMRDRFSSNVYNTFEEYNTFLRNLLWGILYWYSFEEYLFLISSW